MLKNYFLTAFRNFARNSGFTFLSLTGLTLGISCVIAIYSFLKLQTSYDKHQSNYGQVYRAISHWQSGDQDSKFATVPHPLSGGLRADVPGIEDVHGFFVLGAVDGPVRLVPEQCLLHLRRQILPQPVRLFHPLDHAGRGAGDG